MTEFDDDLIADTLRQRAGVDHISTDAALAAVTGRAISTRRRRAALGGAGAMAGIVAVAALVLPGGGDGVIRTPADTDTRPASSGPPTTGPDSSQPTVIATDPEPTTSVTASSATLVGTAPAASAPPTTHGGVPTVAPAGPGATPAPGIGTSPPASPPPATTVAPTTPTAPPPTSAPTTSPATTAPATSPSTSEPDEPDEPGTPPFTGRSYNSAGGSITVSWNGATLSLGGVAPAAGYTSAIEEQRGDRIRVRFEGADSWRIEVRADGGVVTHTISS